MRRILLIANLNSDRVIRLHSPWVNGGRIQGQSLGRRLGGAGANTGVGLVFAGHRVSVACAVGNDATGDWLLTEAEHFGLATDHAVRRPGPTTEAQILLDPDGERTILFVDRQPPYCPPPTVLSPSPDALLVNGSHPALAERMAAAMAAGALVVAQWPRTAMDRWPAHVLVASAADVDPEVLDAPWTAGRTLAGDDLRWVIITQGSRGATAFGAQGATAVPGRAAQVVDTTGAGDVFTAGVTDALLAGHTIDQALLAGTVWASYAVASATSIPPLALKDYLAVSGNATFEVIPCQE